MRSIYNYIISCNTRYNNSKQIDNKELILNTEIFNHQHVNRIGIICSTPLANPLNLKEGDKVLLHHNVFRRWHNVKGIEKNSRSYLKEGEYIISQDQIFMYDKGDSWQAVEGFTFVKPLKSTNKYSLETEKPLIGVVKYSDGTFLPTQLVGFSPGDEFEFVVDGERLYRVMNRFINIEYEYKGNEEEYNPSWAKSS